MCDDDERFFFFFFRLRFDDALTRDLLSLSLSLSEHKNRRSTRTKRSFCENSSGKKGAFFRRQSGEIAFDDFLQAACVLGDDSVSDPRLEKT